MNKSTGTVSSRDKRFFSGTDRPRIEIVFREQDEEQILLPRRHRFIDTTAGWVWVHNEGAASQMSSDVQAEFAHALALFSNRATSTNASSSENEMTVEIITFDVADLEVTQLLEVLASIDGLTFLFLYGDKSHYKEMRKSSMKSGWGTRFIRTDESPRASDEYEVVLSNSWSALSGGPMVFDGWEYVVREVGTKHYFLLNEGDQTLFVDSAYYLGKCQSKKEALARMIDYSILWEMDENGKLVDVSVFEE